MPARIKKAGIPGTPAKTTKGRCGEEHLNDVRHSLTGMLRRVNNIGGGIIKKAGIIENNPGKEPPKEDLEDNILDECCGAV